MKIAILGATGQVGSQLTQEALTRGHDVTGISRHPDALPHHPRLHRVRADLQQYATLSPLLKGHDVAILALKHLDFQETRLLEAVQQAGVPRVLVVGGAGSLEVAPGRALVDTPEFPAEYRAEALAARDTLRQLRGETVLDWTFLSPSAFLHGGPRTGRFRLGRDQLLVDPKGESHVSVADYAVALIDELEKPQHSRQRFTVGY